MDNYISQPDKYFVKDCVSHDEYIMQSYVYAMKIVNVPKVEFYSRREKKMVMQKIEGDNISNIYGEEAEQVPKKIFNRVVRIVKKLYDNNICYPDFTGYNFIIDKNNKIWIIDFEHAYGETSSEINEPNIQEILAGKKSWNRDFM